MKGVYLITDRHIAKDGKLMDTDKFLWIIEQSILGGTTLVQLREKGISDSEYSNLAKKVFNVTSRYNVPLIINDNVKVAAGDFAAGVHLGQSDLDIKEARRVLGHSKIIGITAKSVELAKKAEEAGADYIGTGAAFATDTKPDASITSHEVMSEIKAALRIPMTIIGGINAFNVAALKPIKADMVAVSEGIMKAENPRKATEDIVRNYWG